MMFSDFYEIFMTGFGIGCMISFTGSAVGFVVEILHKLAKGGFR